MALLAEVKQKFQFRIYAYCLMTNHVHLLLEENEYGKVSGFMKKLLMKYVIWHNTKYKRCGTILQGRFKSEVVETERYFAKLIRYIHFNPVKAFLCKTPGDYEYSSYNSFFAENPGIIDRDFVFEFMNSDAGNIAKYHENDDSEIEKERNVLEIDENPPIRVINEKAFAIIQRRIDECPPLPFRKVRRDEIRRFMYEMRKQGVSLRQLGQFFRISKAAVSYWCRDKCR